MAQPEFKADVTTMRATDTFVRPAVAADTPYSSPAHMLQSTIATAFDTSRTKWSARRTLAFAGAFSTVAWCLIGFAAVRLFA